MLRFSIENAVNKIFFANREIHTKHFLTVYFPFFITQNDARKKNAHHNLMGFEKFMDFYLRFFISDSPDNL